MPANTEAILAAIEQARAALDQIEAESAAKGLEEPPAEEAAEGEAPPMPGGMGGMMRKPMMG